MNTAKHPQTLLHLLVLAAIVLLFTWPVLFNGLPDLSADGIYHAMWARNFSGQLWQGEWYPRWLSGMTGGLGAPSFFIYPPFGVYVAALFKPLLGEHDPNGWLMTGWSAALAGLLSAIAAYFWLRDLTDSTAALFGAALYVISPYRLALNLYNGGSLAAHWGVVWMPLVLLAVKWCVEGRRRAIPLLALSYGLLVLTHLPTVLTFSWVIPLAVWFMSEPKQRIEAFLRTFAGVALGIGFAAIYLLPAMLDQSKSWIALVDADQWFYYRNNFLFIKLVSLLEYRVRVLVLVLSMAASTALFFWLLRRFDTDSKRRRLALLYFLTGMGSLVMMTHLSIPVYEVFKFLQKIQFPATRFASALTVSLVATAALAFPFLSSLKTRAVVGMLIIGWIGADVWAASTAFSAWRRIPEERAARDRKTLELQCELFDQWPRPADSMRLSEIPALEAFLAAHPARSLVQNTVGATADVESWRPRLVAIKVHSPEDGRMTIGHFYYRDWRAHIQGSGQSAAVTPSPEGLLEVETPRGDYTLILELIRDTPEHAGIWISTISLVLICGLSIRAGVRR